MQNPNDKPNIPTAIENLLKESRNYLKEAAEAIDPQKGIATCDKAIEVLREARELADDNDELKAVVRGVAAQAYSQRGHQHRYAGNFRDAVSDLSLAIRYDPAYADDYYYRAISYFKLTEEKQAIRDLNDFIRKADDSILKEEAEKILATLVAKEDPKKVMEHWRSEGQRLNAEASKYTTPPEGVAPEYAMAISYYNRAIESFEKARAIAPKDMMNNLSYLAALKSQADCYSILGEYDLAIVNLGKVIDQNPKVEDYFKRGEAYFKIGQKEAAKADFEMYLKLGKDPEYTEQIQQYLNSLK
jgi:tetratricopeptide (TPR) repeat protein